MSPMAAAKVSWGMGPFHKYKGNPVLAPNVQSWDSRSVFNPAAWTDGQKVYLLYRGEGRLLFPGHSQTSCIGLASSSDGYHFERTDEPVLYPTETYEIPGGCEDPRLTRIGDTFHMTYTAFDGHTARLALAVSLDLRTWEKRGLLFPDELWERFFSREDHRRLFHRGWSKSGALLSEQVNGYYWMYFGDTHIWAAHSIDLHHWEVVQEPVLSSRPSHFDSRLVEPGPPPLLLPDGIWLGYNSADANLRYSFGQSLLSREDPTKVIRRSDTPLLEPSTIDEVKGQVANVVFAEGLVLFKGKWLLYYGMADSRIGVAIGDGAWT